MTEGVPLNHLVGRTFRVGDVVLRGFKLAEPCTYLEGLTRPGVRRRWSIGPASGPRSSKAARSAWAIRSRSSRRHRKPSPKLRYCVKRLVLLLACAALASSACSGGSHDAGTAGKTGAAGARNRVERSTTGIGAAGRRTVVVTPPRARRGARRPACAGAPPPQP